MNIEFRGGGPEYTDSSGRVGPARLYPEGDGAFEFERTVSRLMEMQSDDYLALGHGPK